MAGAAVSVSSGLLTSRARFSYVKLDPAAMDRLLRSESGPVARDLLERGERVKIKAKKLVGVSKPDPVPRKVPHRPGTLRDHIVKRMSIAKGKLRVEIGADVPYAFFHHEGWTGGVIIVPKKQVGRGKNRRTIPYLVFYWAKTGKIHYMTSVRQGSFAGNKFLVNALDAARS